MKSNKDLRLAIRVDRETKDKLTKLAELNRRSLSDYLRMIIEDAVVASGINKQK